MVIALKEVPEDVKNAETVALRTDKTNFQMEKNLP